MNKEIEKYVSLYLLVYIVVLAVCGFFQYMAVCQGKSLACAFDMEGMNTIITTTAYVLTPLIAIIGFLAWKTQHNKTVLSNEAKELWHKFKRLEKKTYALDEIYLRSGQIQELVYFKSVPDLDKETSDLIKEYDRSYPDLNYFTELANDINNNVHQNYYGAIKAYREYIEGIERNTTIGKIHIREEELRNTLIHENRNIRNYLSDFILIK